MPAWRASARPGRAARAVPVELAPERQAGHVHLRDDSFGLVQVEKASVALYIAASWNSQGSRRRHVERSRAPPGPTASTRRRAAVGDSVDQAFGAEQAQNFSLAGMRLTPNYRRSALATSGVPSANSPAMMRSRKASTTSSMVVRRTMGTCGCQRWGADRASQGRVTAEASAFREEGGHCGLAWGA